MIRPKKFQKFKKKPIARFLRSLYLNYTDCLDERSDTVNLYTYQFYVNFHNNGFQNDPYITNIYRTIPYTIQKETHSETWMLVCRELIVFYIEHEDIEEFYLSYMFSNIYRFVVYEYPGGFMIICISHSSSELHNSLQFYLINNCKLKYLILSHFVDTTHVNQKVEHLEEHLEEQNQNQNQDQSDQSDQSEQQDQEERVLYVEGLFEPCGFVILNRNICDKFVFNKPVYKFHDNVGYGPQRDDLCEFLKIINVYIKTYCNYPPNYSIY